MTDFNQITNTLISQNAKLVKAKFNGSGRIYTYLATTEQAKDLHSGDVVVVNTPVSKDSSLDLITEDGMYNLEMVKVVNVVDPEDDPDALELNLQWIVQKVDVTQYNEQAAVTRSIKTELHRAYKRRVVAAQLDEVRQLVGNDSPMLSKLITQATE